MNITALFAGIGGLELGLKKAGHVPLMTCEIWDPAIAVLDARFEGIPNKRDVTKLSDVPSNTELLTAGFPCQDLSQAGLTAGIAGRRSGLRVIATGLNCGFDLREQQSKASL
jgi:DNA (cytosine-5)-methyltransferase 1